MLRPYPVLIPAGVGQIVTVPVDCDFIMVKEASSLFSISIDGETDIPDVERGMIFKGEFRQLRFTNQYATATTAVLLLAKDATVQDYRTLNRPSGPTRAKTLWNGPAGAAALVPATAPLVEVADATRAWLFVRAMAANTGIILLSQAQDDAFLFANLGAGQFERFPWTGPIYLRAQVAADNVAIYGLYY